MVLGAIRRVLCGVALVLLLGRVLCSLPAQVVDRRRRVGKTEQAPPSLMVFPPTLPCCLDLNGSAFELAAGPQSPAAAGHKVPEKMLGIPPGYVIRTDSLRSFSSDAWHDCWESKNVPWLGKHFSSPADPPSLLRRISRAPSSFYQRLRGRAQCNSSSEPSRMPRHRAAHQVPATGASFRSRAKKSPVSHTGPTSINSRAPRSLPAQSRDTPGRARAGSDHSSPRR